jgi:hypothetical protein
LDRPSRRSASGFNRLRQELQDPLFVRTPQGMEPTPVESDRFYAIAYGLTLVVGLYLVWIGGRALLEI